MIHYALSIVRTFTLKADRITRYACVSALYFALCSGCSENGNTLSEQSKIAEVAACGTNYFIAGRGTVRVALSDRQSSMISNVVERLRTQGKLTRADAFWEHGSFWIAGKKYDWYEEYLVFRDAKKRRVICISDQNLENMTKKFRSLGKSPKSVSSNEWATILEILEKPERTGG